MKRILTLAAMVLGAALIVAPNLTLHSQTLGTAQDQTVGALTASTLSVNNATTPAISLASGKTNTGKITISGKTSGSLILTAADATAQAITLTTAAQTSGAATLTIPDMAGAAKTVAWLQSPAFTTPNIGAATGTSVSVTGSVTPTSGATGAAALTNFLKQAFTIDFGAFAGGGASQASAQAMTGVLFGDACSVGVDGDTSAEYATAGVTVTSSGNIKIVITPLTAAGTVNPASHSYTVVCLR